MFAIGRRKVSISGPSAISRATNSMSSFKKLRPRCVLLRGHRNFRIVVALMSGAGYLRGLLHFWLMSAPPQNLMRFLRVAALTGTTLIGLGLSAAIAEECPQKESPIVTDRPDV